MKFLYLSILAIACASSSVASILKRDFSTTIFTPPSSYEVPRTLYARSLMLTVNDASGTLLSTWENYSRGVTWFPIFRSTNHGQSWSPLSNVTDQVNGWGLRYQPILYELKQDFAGYKAGSILLAGNSIPEDLSATKIDLYISTDKGSTWKFLSNIAKGGEADPTNGKTPVWEPFLMVYNNQLHCFYSDQRDTKYGQKLVHQSTTDLKTWSNVVDDVTDSDYNARPGMATIAQMGNGNYIMTFEYCGTKNCDVYYKISNDPTRWNNLASTQLIAKDGTAPSSSPFTIWTPVGAQSGSSGVKTTNGTVVTNAYSDGSLYVNKQNGNPGCGIVIQEAEDKFLCIGWGYSIYFSHENKTFTGISRAIELKYINTKNGKGTLANGRLLNGDETRSGTCLTMPNEYPDEGGFPIPITIPAGTAIAICQPYAF